MNPLRVSFYRLSSAFLAGALMSLPVLAADSSSNNEVVARAGSVELKADEIKALLSAADPREQAAIAKDPALLTRTVRALLARKAALREALAKKWDQQPQVIVQLERVKEAAIVESYLDSIARMPSDFPSDSEVQAAYDANKSAFMAPRQYRLAQIFVAAPKPDKSAEEKTRLDDLVKKLRGRGADFAALAREWSDNKEEGAQGGEIGWLSEAQVIPDIRSQITGLSKEGVTEPIKLDDGWHILKLLDTKPAGPRPLAEVREQIIQSLRNERAQALRGAALSKLFERNPPVINEIALSKIIEKPAKP